MRQIKIKRLCSMHCAAESAGEFSHNNLFEKSGHRKNATYDPKHEDRERGQPRPPSKPGCRFLTSCSCPQSEGDDSRQKESVDDRALNQHGHAEKNEDPKTIPTVPSTLFSNLFPNEPTDEKDNQSEWHISPHQCR